MMAVIFEVVPAPHQQSAYLDLAATLHEHLHSMEGFISVERFQSLSSPGKLLSLSFWDDEAAVSRWRQQMAHRQTQRAGRQTVFEDYRLRVAHVVRDYGLHDRDEAPEDSQTFHRR